MIRKRSSFLSFSSPLFTYVIIYWYFYYLLQLYSSLFFKKQYKKMTFSTIKLQVYGQVQQGIQDVWGKPSLYSVWNTKWLQIIIKNNLNLIVNPYKMLLWNHFYICTQDYYCLLTVEVCTWFAAFSQRMAKVRNFILYSSFWFSSISLFLCMWCLWR